MQQCIIETRHFSMTVVLSSGSRGCLMRRKFRVNGLTETCMEQVSLKVRQESETEGLQRRGATA